MHRWHTPTHQRTCILVASEVLHNDAFGNHYIYQEFLAQHHIEPAYTSIHINMDPVNYWSMAREYCVWNAAIAALQFWTADLKACISSSTIEQVYNASFYSISTYMLCQESDEVLFGHFVTTLNVTFESKLTLEDVGYDSGSKNFNIAMPLR